ncbi:sensor histidine kinase [Streptomyces malaysiensis subsp. malaysiensis]|uniref:sensor histidine kinase n=1 Tax=Streptomyces malaysiensis TaxID=92644 RepID=UPI000BFF2E28|nr:two component system sensor kinase [Streptomyces malaysiensis]QDL74440.1 sensor histidine kinase [Streptomyces malaysiensis]
MHGFTGEHDPGQWPGQGPGGRWRRMPFGPARPTAPWRSSLVIAVVQLVGTGFAAHKQPDRMDLGPAAAVLLLAGPALLLMRHRRPGTAVVGTAAVTAVYLAVGYPYGPVFFSVVVACVTAVAAGRRVAAWSALGLLWGSHLLIGHWLYRWLPPDGDGPVDWGQELVITAWAMAIVAASELARVRREQWARVRAEREAAARRRADEERLRIARELHDVLAHSISVINVQAGVGLALLDQDPEQARTALTTIKAASKEALGEVRQVLDTLRTSGASGAAPRSPAPGLDRLEELTGQAAAAGLAVRVEVAGVRTALPPGADLAAFRIVQEALTNIVRHSGSRNAHVLLRYAPGELELRVDDDGPAAGGEVTGGGNGLVGMRERAAALGGTVEAGPRPDGGFRVRARIPFRGGAPHKDGVPGVPQRNGVPGAPHRDGVRQADGVPHRDGVPHADGVPHRDGKETP